MSSLLRTKRFVWVLALVLSTAAMIYSYVSGSRYLDAVRAIERTLEVSEAIEKVMSTLADEETGQRGYLLTGDVAFLEPYYAGKKTLPAELTRLADLTAENRRQQTRIALLHTLAREKQAFMEETLTLRSSGRDAEVVTLIGGKRGKLLMDQIRRLGEDMQAEERQLLAARSAKAARTQKQTMVAVGFGAALTLLLLLASVLSVHRDAEEVRRAAEELAASEERFRVLADNASDLVRLLSPDGAHFYVSPSIERLLGYPAEELLGSPATALLHPDDVEATLKLVAALREKSAERGSLVQRMRHRDGDYRWFDTIVTCSRDADGEVRHVHMTGRDVSDRRRAEQQLAQHAAELKRLSLRDPLTGLYNRRGFLELGAQLMKLAERGKRRLSLVFIDLDGLKRINDELGHEVGDRAIHEAAEVLQSTCRASDILARLGGDEFVVLASDVDAGSVDFLKARIDRAVEQRNASSGRPYALAFSVGAAFYDPESPESLEALLARADACMYTAKRQRKASLATA